ncbi:MAG: class I SAM-dependent methyltransferase [Deltaproteobacteria bacterium]|nr:class I SAM-dependent methyltransferase [Deltaproteobacteria bacterium]
MPSPDARTAADLAGIALAFGARDVAGWSDAEERLARTASRPDPAVVRRLRAELLDGGDPLGERFCALRSAELRRPLGATYTPAPIVRAMLAWARRQRPLPSRIVDPGAGSGRYLLAAAATFPDAELVGVEIDPLAAMLARGDLAAIGAGARTTVHLADFRACTLPRTTGPTLFVGNPPYVRHHRLDERWKRWLVDRASSLGCRASQLAGLHVHFFVATAIHARPGDRGAYVTAAEWLDVNYGRLVRDLLMGVLGATGIHVLEPAAQPFADAATTAAITCFEVGRRPPSLRVRRVETLDDLGALDGGRSIRRDRLEAAPRWSPLLATRRGPDGPRSGGRPPVGYVELGDLCRVHRGAVTGANAIWIVDGATDVPESFLHPTVTKARELFAAGAELLDASSLRRVIDLPIDLDTLDDDDRARVERFLRRAATMGAKAGYIARTRRAWWSVGLRAPAPILATYMARRPPAFVRNRAQARHINIAHGLYPRLPLSATALDRLADYLATRTSVADGRTYAGGLTKFEPREMERLLVPDPDLLVASDAPRA